MYGYFSRIGTNIYTRINIWFLRQIPVIIFQSHCAPLKMACFLHWSTRLVTYPWSLYRMSVVGGGRCCARKARCAKLVGGVDSNGWGCKSVHTTLLAREIYSARPIPNPTPSLYPRNSRDLEHDILRASRSTTLQTRLLSGC